VNRAVVISGGDVTDYEFIGKYIKEDDYIVCADRGIVHCDKLKLKADLWIGDFDSCDYEAYKDCDAAKEAKVISLPSEKDETDTEYALKYISEETECKNILLLGGIGTRMDHTITNIHMLRKMADSEMSMEILNEKNRIRLSSSSSGIFIEKSDFKYVSIIPLSDVISGVTCTDGFKYKLEDAVMFRNESLGVSNELIEKSGSIFVGDGSALIIESRD